MIRTEFLLELPKSSLLPSHNGYEDIKVFSIEIKPNYLYQQTVSYPSMDVSDQLDIIEMVGYLKKNS